MIARFISPTGSGLQDGSSPQNAGTLASLNAFVSAVGAGGQVLLLADKGAYRQSTEIALSSGGSDKGPITIRGIDSHGEPMAAQIVGSRTPNWTPGHAEGSELFRLKPGANNLSFQDLAVSNVGNGVFRAGADLHDISISRVSASNVTRFFENNVTGDSKTATVAGLTIQDVKIAGYSKEAINLGYDSHDITIKNVVGDSQGQNGGGLYMTGVHLNGTVHNVLLSSVEMKNNLGKGASTEYWNGDGFTTERGVHDIRFEDTSASGNTDAGYDLKSSNTVLVNTSASGNMENYRFWSNSISVTNGVSLSPKSFGGVGAVAHVWMADAAIATLNHFTFADSGKPQTLFNLTQTGSLLHLIDTSIPAAYADQIRTDYGSKVEVIGGAGNDTFHVNTVGTVVIEGANHGIDTVATHLAQYTLGANVENLLFTDATGHQGNGNTLDNTITGGAAGDALNGLAGNDTVSGGDGSDILHGNAGTDKISGGNGLDQLFGDDGNDSLGGGAGDDRLDGGIGTDYLSGADGNDILTGGADNVSDTLIGGQGADTYLFGKGFGRDLISTGDNDGGVDTLRLSAGIKTTDLWMTHHGDDLVISIVGTGDSATLVGWYDSWNNKLGSIALADGTKITTNAIEDVVNALASTGSAPVSLSALAPAHQDAVVHAIAASWH
jgi:Ca2+-binding RTX toxin-like protein